MLKYVLDKGPKCWGHYRSNTSIFVVRGAVDDEKVGLGIVGVVGGGLGFG